MNTTSPNIYLKLMGELEYKEKRENQQVSPTESHPCLSSFGVYIS